jgi:hypothetical protein
MVSNKEREGAREELAFQGTMTEGHWDSRLPRRLGRRSLASVEFRPLESAHISDDSSTGKLWLKWGAWECASYCSRVSPSSSRSTTRVTHNLGCAVEEEYQIASEGGRIR